MPLIDRIVVRRSLRIRVLMLFFCGIDNEFLDVRVPVAVAFPWAV